MRKNWINQAALVCGALAAGFWLRSATAATPASVPLSYSGRITNNGVPVSAANEIISVKLFDASMDGTVRCQSSTVAGVPIVDGHFRVPLLDGCETALGTYGDLWAEVSWSGVTFPRNKVGAVPYAVEAVRANAAGGGLATQLSTLAPRSSVPTITAWETIPNILVAPFTDPTTPHPQTTRLSWRRVGDTIDVEIETRFTGTPTNNTGMFWEMPQPLPDVDTTKTVGVGVATLGAPVNQMAVCEADVRAGERRFSVACPGSFPIGPAAPVQMQNGSYIHIRLSYAGQGLGVVSP